MAATPIKITRSHERLRTVCMYCERIRITRGNWRHEQRHQQNAPTSHGVCPTCYQEALGDLLVQLSADGRKAPRIA